MTNQDDLDALLLSSRKSTAAAGPVVDAEVTVCQN